MYHTNARHQKGKLWRAEDEAYGNSVLSAQFFCKPKTALLT